MKKQSNLTATYPTLPELTFRGMFLGMLITDIFVIYSGGSHLHGNPAHVQKLQYSGK